MSSCLPLRRLINRVADLCEESVARMQILVLETQISGRMRAISGRWIQLGTDGKQHWLMTIQVTIHEQLVSRCQWFQRFDVGICQQTCQKLLQT